MLREIWKGDNCSCTCDASLNLRRHSLKNAKMLFCVCNKQVFIGHLKMMCGLFWLRSAAVIQSRGARVQPQVNGGDSLPEQWVCLLVIYLCVLRRSPLISSVYIHLHIKRKFQDTHTHHLKQAFFCSFLCPRFYLAACLHFDNCFLISFLYIDWQP